MFTQLLRWCRHHGLFGVLVIFLSSTPYAHSAATVEIFSGHGTSGGGAPYTDLVGTFTTSDVLFATNTGYNWHPFGLGDFGALITGALVVPADGTYTFTLDSDDGSLLFIDGLLIVDNGGPHGPQSASNDAILDPGTHLFEIQFFEDFGGESGLDFLLPDGVTIANGEIPEPVSVWLFVAGLMGFVCSRGLLRSATH